MARSPQSGRSRGTVASLLARPDTTLSGVLQHAQALLEVENLLRNAVDTDLAGQFQVAALRKNRLILISPSAALATRLKLTAPQMLEYLRSNNVDCVEHIDLRVAPLSREVSPQKRRKQLTPAAKKSLDALSTVLKKPSGNPDGG